VQQPDPSFVEGVLQFFRWLAEQVGIDRAIGIVFGSILLGMAWRVYTDRRKDRDRAEELAERNRTIQVLERELAYYKVRELAGTSGLSFEEARRLVESTGRQALNVRGPSWSRSRR
jgi:type II secretory pathway component PulJ